MVTSTLVFEGGGQVNEYVGGYSDWLRQRKGSGGKARPAAAPPAAPVSVPTPAPTATATAAPKGRRLSYKDQRELAAMPDKIQRLEAEQMQLQAAIGDPNLFKNDPARAEAALQRLQSLAAELESAYSRWDALESQALT